MAEQRLSNRLRSRELFGVSRAYFLVADLRPWGIPLFRWRLWPRYGSGTDWRRSRASLQFVWWWNQASGIWSHRVL